MYRAGKAANLSAGIHTYTYTCCHYHCCIAGSRPASARAPYRELKLSIHVRCLFNKEKIVVVPSCTGTLFRCPLIPGRMMLDRGRIHTQCPSSIIITITTTGNITINNNNTHTIPSITAASGAYRMGSTCCLTTRRAEAAVQRPGKTER